jgi:general secretion pathway protein I
MRASSRSFAAGFTLLEVLAALVIISLGMLAVIEAIGQTASNSTRMRDRTLAHWIAMNRLTTARLEPRAPKIAKTSDEVEMAGRRWRWTMEVSETPVQSMRRIDVRVAEAGGADDERSLAQVTGFYGSAIAAAGTLTAAWQGAPVPDLPPGNDPGTQQPGTQQPGEPPSTSDNEEPVAPVPDGEPVDPPVPDRPESEE